MQHPDKDLKIEFAPGCFDDWDGTPEELQEMIAQIHQMAADGTLFENSEPVPPEEIEEIEKLLEERSKRQ